MPKFLTSLETSSAAAAQYSWSQIDHLDTKYGLRRSFENGQNGQIATIRIVHPLSQPATDSPTTNPPTTDPLTTDTHTTLVDNNVP